jgi:hypothetical protein
VFFRLVVFAGTNTAPPKGTTMKLLLKYLRVRVTEDGILISLECLDENNDHHRIDVPVKGDFEVRRENGIK